MFHPLRRFTKISRAGIIKVKRNLCLFGFPDEKWEVNLPAEKVPSELLEPLLGINFARDGIPNKDWLYLVALHSDAWLLSVAFFFGASFGFDKADRELPRNQSITPKDMASEDHLNQVGAALRLTL